ncbi:MAG: hypothetical protein AB1938_30015 [Myxococcota bacterium]
MKPTPEQVELRLEELAALCRLSDSLLTARGALLTWTQLAERGLALHSAERFTSWALEEGDEAWRAGPSRSTHHVGEVFTAALVGPGASPPLLATLVGVSSEGGRRDSLPAGAEGVVIIRLHQGTLVAGSTLIDGRLLNLVAR